MSIIEKAMDRKSHELGEKTSVKAHASLQPRDQTAVPVRQKSGVGSIALLRRLCEQQLEVGGAKLKRQIIEELRRIKRPLLRNIEGKGATVAENTNLIMITSALPGEGKTFTALHLAESIALEREKTVLLIDADSERATLTKSLEMEGTVGLVDYLADEISDISEIVTPTDIENVRYISSGRTHPHAVELFSSDKMKRFADEISGRYPDRIVIFDAPPLLVSNEAVVTASLMGQILVVVQAEKSKESDVLDALAILDETKIVGVILNGCRSGSHKGYYYSYSDESGDDASSM